MFIKEENILFSKNVIKGNQLARSNYKKIAAIFDML